MSDALYIVTPHWLRNYEIITTKRLSTKVAVDEMTINSTKYDKLIFRRIDFDQQNDNEFIDWMIRYFILDPHYWLIGWLIHFGYFYSASSSPILLRGAPDTARILCGVHAEAPKATASEGLAQGSYVAARAGFEPTTHRSTDIDSTNEPSLSGVNLVLSLGHGFGLKKFWFSSQISENFRFFQAI